MYRAIPAASKILAKKWQQEQDARHLENLKNIKGTVNNGAPVKLDHLKKKSKKTQIMEGKSIKTCSQKNVRWLKAQLQKSEFEKCVSTTGVGFVYRIHSHN